METALGDYLEAVCVERIDGLGETLASFAKGRVTLIEAAPGTADAAAETLAAKVDAPAAVIAQLSGVLTAESLAEALQGRSSLGAGESIITRNGEWVGRDWLRINRGSDPHAGVIEREHRLKSLRSAVTMAEERTSEVEAHLAAVRQSLTDAEAEREQAQSGIHSAHRRHADVMSHLEGARARLQEATARRERLDDEAADVAEERGVTQEALARARAEFDRGSLLLVELDSRKDELEGEREYRREGVTAARGRNVEPNVYRAVTNHPRALQKMVEFGTVVYFQNSLTPAQRELSYLTASVTNDCHY